MTMLYRQAEERDLDTIMELIQKRIRWMEDNRLEQWNRTGYLDSYPRTYFRENLCHFYVAEEVGRVVGAVAAYPEDERWQADRKAWYLHHFVSDPAVRGVGEGLLAFLEELAPREGIQALRLDSDIHNEKLGQYYERHGYLPRGECVDGPYVGVKREKEL